MGHVPFGGVAVAIALTVSAGLARAEADAGAYLSARAASAANDFDAAARFYTLALSGEEEDPALLENAIVTLVCSGLLDEAVPLADRLVGLGYDSLVGNLIAQAGAVQAGDWNAIFAALEAGHTISPLVDGVARAWAYVGLGEMGRALSAFDEVIEAPGLRAFGLYHKALALASVGDFEGADAILSMPQQQGLRRSRRATIAHAQVLGQLGRHAEGVARIQEVFGTDLDPVIGGLRDSLARGDVVPFDLVTDARSGMAEVYFSVSSAIAQENQDGITLLYARLAHGIDPAHMDAILLSAALLDHLEQHDLAVATFATVPPTSTSFYSAELGRADALRNSGQAGLAAEVLQQLARGYPESAVVQASLGDVLRRLDRTEEANAAYSRALELYPEGDSRRWFALFTRGITNHKLDNWPAAEADFRAALEINPGQPQVLNFLGYSLVERQENLDEALGMIEEAVAAQPQNGAIVDSLGWALYRLGRYEEAVIHMERAAALEPVDPVVNDHLGDVFWAVGRSMEARFQWQRALSFDPEEADADRIRRKLEVGLDAVLVEEGAAPLEVARGG